jgi:ComF family protein
MPVSLWSGPGASVWRRLQDLLAVVLPPACCVCGVVRDLRGEAGACAACWSGVEYLSGAACPRCGAPHPDLEDADLEGVLCAGCLAREPPFHAGMSMGVYRGPLKRLIRLLKFSGRPDLAGPLAARAAVVLRRRRHRIGALEAVVPVPLSLPRRLSRGYNQASLLARHLGRQLDLPLHTGLSRRLLGRPQAGLPRHRRAGNVQGAFRASRSLEGLSVLLVDDVWTTGATLSECSRALRRAGARRVVAFSLARTPGFFDLEGPGGLD